MAVMSRMLTPIRRAYVADAERWPTWKCGVDERRCPRQRRYELRRPEARRFARPPAAEARTTVVERDPAAQIASVRDSNRVGTPLPLGTPTEHENQ